MRWRVRYRSLWECLGHAACGGPTLLIRFTENPPHPVGLGHNNLILTAEQSATGKYCFILLSIYIRLANKLSPTLCRWVHQGELVIDDHDSRSCIRPLEILNSCFRINKHSFGSERTIWVRVFCGKDWQLWLSWRRSVNNGLQDAQSAKHTSYDRLL